MSKYGPNLISVGASLAQKRQDQFDQDQHNDNDFERLALHGVQAVVEQLIKVRDDFQLARDDGVPLLQIEPLPRRRMQPRQKQIADQLSITEETVKGRVKNILSKLGANDRTHAAMIGVKRGIIFS